MTDIDPYLVLWLPILLTVGLLGAALIAPNRFRDWPKVSNKYEDNPRTSYD